MARSFAIADIRIGGRNPLVLIAGPCVIDSENATFRLARQLKTITQRLGFPFIFKASYDKANRTSVRSYRGPGLKEGLRILAAVKREVGVPVLADVHETSQVLPASEVLDVIQIPAFLCRQTDLIMAAARQGKPINIKKGQFLSPSEIAPIIQKTGAAKNRRVLITERGATFGYNNLVVDMRSLAVLKQTNCPVVFDATHSVQLPGGEGARSGGQREFVPVLARAAVAAGVSGLFLETHPDPDKAPSDGPNAWPLAELEALIEPMMALDATAKQLQWPD